MNTIRSGGDDLLVDEFAPHFVALAGLHAHVEEAAGAEIHVHGDHGEGRRRPPELHVVRLGQHVPDALARGVEDPENGKIYTTGTRHRRPRDC